MIVYRVADNVEVDGNPLYLTLPSDSKNSSSLSGEKYGFKQAEKEWFKITTTLASTILTQNTGLSQLRKYGLENMVKTEPNKLGGILRTFDQHLDAKVSRGIKLIRLTHISHLDVLAELRCGNCRSVARSCNGSEHLMFAWTQ